MADRLSLLTLAANYPRSRMAENLKSYHDWLRAGRFVCKGEAAEYYLVSPDGQERVALFSEEQTDDAKDETDRSNWTLYWVGDLPKRERVREPSDKPKLRIEYDTETATVHVWAGPSKEAIKTLRKNKYQYNAGRHRWYAVRPDIRKVVDGFRQTDKYTIIATVDGEPYDQWAPAV